MNKTKANVKSTTIRVDTGRLDLFMNLVGEVVITRTRLMQISDLLMEKYGQDEYMKELGAILKIFQMLSSELQESIMKLRLVPIKILFKNLPRLVRDLSSKLNKQIKMTIYGEDTEIDRAIVELLSDPLMHIIRNSIDHGIESEDERIIAGKSVTGNVTINAYHDGNNIVLEIADDGKGISVDLVKEKALTKGLATQTEINDMSDKEILNFIFNAGFSTAQAVTNVSGRGVGMDVVKSNIERINGIVDINSTYGLGTTIIIKLPLTMAIFEALIVETSSQKYTLPLSNVLEVMEVSGKDIEKVNNGLVYKLRDRYISLILLEDLFSNTDSKDSVLDTNKKYNIVFTGLADRRLGIAVKNILGQQEIAVKQLGDYLGKVKYVSGATILGTGEALLILDVPSIIRSVIKEY